jgi:hypothetical protein
VPNPRSVPPHAQIELAFDAYDLNGDGHLDRSELCSVLTAVFAALSSMGVSFHRTRYSASAAKSCADELFDILDADRKGFVSRRDYLDLVETRPQVFHQLVGNGSMRRSREGHHRASPDRHSHRVRPSNGRSRRRMDRGRSVIVGDSNWELVVQMMIGMRISLAAVDEAVAQQVVLEVGTARARSSRRTAAIMHSGESGAHLDARAAADAAAARVAAVASFSRQLDRHLLEVYKFALPSVPSRRSQVRLQGLRATCLPYQPSATLSHSQPPSCTPTHLHRPSPTLSHTQRPSPTLTHPPIPH